MKTNKFENTIRRKLESIQPDFQEQDWAKMQQYMQVHSPPTLWQQYGSWIGYAAAASVTSVMAFLYLNQLSQNDHLVSDVKNLKGQIEVIKNQPAAITKTDTVYLVQKEAVAETGYIASDNVQTDDVQADNKSITPAQHLTENNADVVTRKSTASSSSENRFESATTSETMAEVENNVATGKSQSEPASKDAVEMASDVKVKTNRLRNTGQSPASSRESVAYASNMTSNEADPSAGTESVSEKTLSPDFGQMDFINSANPGNFNGLSRKMNYTLASRLNSKQVQKYLNENKAQVTSDSQIAAVQNTKSGSSAKKTAKAENVIPKFNIKAPYRFGGGINMERNGQAKTVVAEVLLAKKFSITTGISWLKVKPMEFFTEKVFRAKNKQDFKHANPGEVPLALDVYNIKVNPTVVQIPLTIAFRNDIKDDWAYFAGVGTNVTLTAKENISFDCKVPNSGFYNKTFDKKMDMPAINSINFSMGIEKAWYPIVIQAEGYLYTYFSPLTPLGNAAGPGLKLKLLYQIGRKM